MKKYFIIAAAAALTLAACSKVTMDEAPEQVIAFQAANRVNATKADGQNDGHLELYKAGSFKAFGYFTPTDWDTDKASYNGAGTDASKAFMPGVAVTYNTELGTWATENDYYWPKTGKISFTGYYPSTAAGVPENLDQSKTSINGKDNTIKFENYIVDATVATQRGKVTVDGTTVTNDTNDLMVVNFIADQTENNDQDQHFTNGVAMIFNHTLAKVKINAAIKKLTATETEGANKTVCNNITYAITLDDVQINNIFTKATYTSGAWGAATVAGNSGTFYVGDKTAPAVVAKDANISGTTPLTNKLTQIGYDYYVMPQNIDDASTITVKYTVYVLDSEGKILSKKQHVTTTDPDEDDDKGRQAPIQLNQIKNTAEPAVAIAQWKKNTVYNYNLVISPVSEDPIYFDAAVVDWATPEENSQEIPVQETK